MPPVGSPGHQGAAIRPLPLAMPYKYTLYTP